MTPIHPEEAMSTGITTSIMIITMAGIGGNAVFLLPVWLRISWKGLSMLDDLFGGSKHKRHSGHYGDDRHHTGYGDESHGHYNPLLELAQKYLHNKAIIAGIVLTILIIFALGIWLLVTLMPYLSQVFSIVEKQGIKGILETITPLLQRIWEGTAK